jgi:hypothetical protein
MGVTNPLVISVSAEEELNNQSDSGFANVRDYITNSITNSNVMIMKYQSNLQSVQQVIIQIEQSFERRVAQYREDQKIVEEVNKALQDFRDNHQDNISQLIQGVHQVVDDEVTKYRNEIIRRLEPTTIRERFPERTAFEEWLIMLNENYAKVMNEAIDRKSQKAIRNYIGDMEDVLNTCLKYITDREERLDAEDIFYGSLAKSKQSVVKISQLTMCDISNLNRDLLDASIELFAGVWAARREYDRNMTKKLQNTAMIGYMGTTVATGATAITTGAITGLFATGASKAAVAGATKVAAVGVTKVAAAAGGASLGTTLAPILIATAVVAIGGILATQIMKKHAKKMGEVIYSAQMEQQVQLCIDKFCVDVENSRLEIRDKLETDIFELFSNELKFMERSFLEFRLSTHVDSEKLPVLERQLLELKNEANSFFTQNHILQFNSVGLD